MFNGDALLQPFLVVTELRLLESCEASNGQCHVGSSVSVLLVRRYSHSTQSIEATISHTHNVVVVPRQRRALVLLPHETQQGNG